MNPRPQRGEYGPEGGLDEVDVPPETQQETNLKKPDR
jgi:hypothetical protein